MLKSKGIHKVYLLTARSNVLKISKNLIQYYAKDPVKFHFKKQQDLRGSFSIGWAEAEITTNIAFYIYFLVYRLL